MNNASSDLNGAHSATETYLASSEHPESYTGLKSQSCSSNGCPTPYKGSDSPEQVGETSSTSRSEYYRLMYNCLQEKFDYVQASTDRLRDRLYHVKKEVTYLKRMKRVLIRRLARYGESYSYAPLEIPDNVDIEDPVVKRRKERRERERERKEAIRAAKRAQCSGREENNLSGNLMLTSSGGIGSEQGSSQVC
nr:hypothetical protein HCOI_01460200 [Haemonchus contortus]